MSAAAKRLREIAEEFDVPGTHELVEARLTVSDGERTYTITRRG